MLSNCQWTDKPERAEGAAEEWCWRWLYSKGPVMWLTCSCNPASHLSHGYWDVRLRLFKVFVVHRKGDLRLTYYKWRPGSPEHVYRGAQPQPRDIERQLKDDASKLVKRHDGTLAGMDEITAMMQRVEFKKAVSNAQQTEGKYLPQGISKCPLCDLPAPPFRARSPACCGYVFHRLCNECSPSHASSCPLCPRSPVTPGKPPGLSLPDFDYCQNIVRDGFRMEVPDDENQVTAFLNDSLPIPQQDTHNTPHSDIADDLPEIPSPLLADIRLPFGGQLQSQAAECEQQQPLS